MAKLERAELTRQRSGREPTTCVSLWNWRRVEVIPQLQVGSIWLRPTRCTAAMRTCTMLSLAALQSYGL